jgi:hypothetical protein
VKKIRLYVLGLFIGLLIAFGGAVTFSYYKGDQIAAVVVKNLNKYLNTKIEVEKIHFSVIQKFPYACIDLKNVTAFSTDNFKMVENTGVNTDTLFHARHLFLEFNLLDLLKNQLRLKNISLENANINLYINKLGKDNFHILKTDSDTSNESGFQIDLQKLIITRTSFVMWNENKQMNVSGRISETEFKGKFLSENFDLSTSGKFHINNYVLENVTFIKNQNFSFDIEAKAQQKIYTISKGLFEIGDLPLQLSGSINAKREPNLNLMLKGNKLNLRYLLDATKNYYPEIANDLSLSGKISISAQVIGKIDKVHIPSINILMDLYDADIETSIDKKQLKFEKVNLHANFNNGSRHSLESSFLNLIIHNLNFGNSALSGSLLTNNFKLPKIDSNIKLKFNIEDIKLLPISNLKELKKGILEGNLIYQGNLDIDHFDLGDFLQTLKSEGTITDLEYSDNDIHVEHITGKYQLAQQLNVNDISFEYQTMPFVYTGTINNIPQFIKDSTVLLDISGSVKGDLFNFSKLSGNSNSTSEDLSVAFPSNFILDLNIKLGKIIFNHFSANNISAHINYKPKIFVINSLTLSSMNGNINGSGAVAQKMNGDLVVKCISEVKNISIEKMFSSFDNFGQDVLKAEHLKGTLSGKINLSSEWNKKLEVNQDKILSDCTLELTNGELINFTPLLALSKFINIEELKHIYFSTIKNQIFIRNRVITIPQMDITSSAIDLSVSGTHNFDNEYDYRVKLLLSEILFGKAKKARAETSENAEQDTDNKGKMKLYLNIVGKGSDFKVKYDKKGARNSFIQNVKTEKNTMKSILNEEFGLFKGDSVPQETPKIHPKGYSIEWDESDKKTEKEQTQKAGKQETKKDKKPFKIEWDDK